MKFTCYIPCAGDPPLTQRAVDSLLKELEDYPDASIVILNNMEKPLFIDYPPSRLAIVDMPVRLLHGQSINLIIREACNTEQPFAMSLHNDAMLYPGAVKELLAEWERVQAIDPKWGTIMLGHNNGDAFVLWNPAYNYAENVWHDPFLLPMYYMDNHYYRIQELRGWHRYSTEHDLLLHEGSHSIKNDPIMRRKNDIVFRHHGAIYKDIWGGLPGSETSNDPYANGTLSRNK